MSTNRPKWTPLKFPGTRFSVSELNAIAEAVLRLTGGTVSAGVSGSTGVHTGSRSRPPTRQRFFRIISEDENGAYTVKEQTWNENTHSFDDAAGASNETAYEFQLRTTGAADDIVLGWRVLDTDDDEILLIEIPQPAGVLLAGIAEATSTEGNIIELDPCTTAGEDKPGEDNVYVYVSLPTDNYPYYRQITEGAIYFYQEFETPLTDTYGEEEVSVVGVLQHMPPASVANLPYVTYPNGEHWGPLDLRAVDTDLL